MADHTTFDDAGQDAKLAAIREKEEEDLAQVLSSRYGVSYTDLGVVPIDVDALRLIPEERARAAEVVAFAKIARQVSVALRNPKNPALAAELAELEARGFVLTKFLVSPKSLSKAYSRYADLSLATVSTAGTFDISGEELEKLSAELTTLGALKDRLTATIAEKKGAQVSKIFEEILAAAFVMKASDIHIEPEEDAARVRLRLDGMLTDIFSFDHHVYRSLNSRIKLLSGLKLNVTDRAQDGRFTVVVNGMEIEIRCSVIPGNYGESVVLRILDPRAIQRTLSDIGINDKLLARLQKEIRRPTGMLLNTGPTGSGKTTSLYTFMRDIHSPEIKIVTIEDPVEYHIQGIVQTQVGPDYTFASGLRSVLRQDPDVIMVGEIRDAEVAETAIQAALTGHFVFSTLHTNNAAGTFPRLVDLEVDPKLFASAVTVSMAQRLVRTLDETTKKSRPATAEEKRMMETVLSTLTDKSLIPPSMDTVWVAVPGEDGSTGYKGRMGIHEAIFMDDELGEFLRDNPSESDIAKHVLRQGYPTLAQDGIIKVLQGKTSIEELARVVDLPLG
ncbi:MAG: type II/IV secretion system protein [Candidatus Pacebacteria bacterium]|nr:type II/IV secretion system protein [Candidatus Paceibacterota bacterium]